jgi:uncharacterized protein (TIGR01777 family)
MKVLIAGGSGFMGSALMQSLQTAGHTVWILSRRAANGPNILHWDGAALDGWSERVRDMDAVINVTGYGLEHWLWTKSRKQKFLDSRVVPGRALVEAIGISVPRPSVFLQISGINYYGLRGDVAADETTSPAEDYLAQLTVQWEAATEPVEEFGLRRIVARSGVVLGAHGGLFPLMGLPVRLFVGGPLGDGQQAFPWIHLVDQVQALRFLLESEEQRGVFNLVAPTATSNSEYMRAIAKALHRPYWFTTPTVLLRAALGEMSTLVVDGRYSLPERLLEAGYRFRFPTIEAALDDLFQRSG